MKFLLAAINAKYIHSNPGVYSLRAFARTKIPWADIEIGEYTINHQMDLILQDIYRRKPDFIGFSCYIWNISYIMEIVRDVKKVLPEVEIWLGGPEVSYDAKKVLTIFIASTATPSILAQISSASCSTQPGFGKYCVNSFWATLHISPFSLKSMQRLLVVPASSAMMYFAM